MTDATPVEAPEPKRLGRNQWIAIGMAAVPFFTATAFTYWGVSGADFNAWAKFVGDLLPWTLGIALGGSAVVKVAENLGAR